MYFSYLTELLCSGCGEQYSAKAVNTYCPACQSPLLANYDLETLKSHADREQFSCRPRGIWRWHEVLPVFDPENVVTLGEGDTPLLRLPRLEKATGTHHLFVKDESSNPTGSFKARGLSVAVSKAKELGIQKVIIPTAGNAGGAMAAYAARAGLRAHIFMPKDTPRPNFEESRMVGAEVTLVDGLISEAAGMAGEKARAEGWFDLSTFKEPYRVEGKKIMGYELAEAFDWSLPDVIIYLPVEAPDWWECGKPSRNCTPWAGLKASNAHAWWSYKPKAAPRWSRLSKKALPSAISGSTLIPLLLGCACQRVLQTTLFCKFYTKAGGLP